MALSNYPLTFDASPPGYPYQDQIEYITGEQANYWISMMQALENTLGFGTASSTANPLYSSTSNKYFSTVAARLTALETGTEGAGTLDTAAGDIQPVGLAAVAGNAGLAADAKHVHQGVKSFNTRSGPVTLTTADILALLTTPGSLFVGGPGNTGQLLTMGPANSVLQVDPTGSFLQFGSAGSSTVASGDTKFTTALAIPTGWIAANGAAVSRSTYAALLAASTITQSVTVINANNVISGINATAIADMAVGQAVEVPGYYAAGTTITAVGSSSITLSNNSTNGGTATLTVFPYGNGNGSTTFNVVNIAGKVPVGSGGAGGNAAPTYSVGASGGEQTHALVVGENGVHSHGITDNGHAHGLSDPTHSHGVSDPTHLHAVADVGHVHGLPNGTEFAETVVSGTEWLVGTTDPYRVVTVSFTPYTTQVATGIAIESAASNVSIVAGATGASVISAPAALANQNSGSGSGHNNMQPYTVGKWLVKT